ncbi:MAG: hypothetical protein ABL949_16540 [Fimbriimonadaceae bacterium]
MRNVRTEQEWNQVFDACLSDGNDTMPGVVLLPTLRSNLTMGQMGAMPGLELEQKWRSIAEPGAEPLEFLRKAYGSISVDYRKAVHGIVWPALGAPPNMREPFRYTFDLARSLLAIHAKAAKAVNAVPPAEYRKIVEMLIDGVLSLSLIGTSSPEWFDRETIWLEFADAWEKIRCPDGMSPIEFAFKKAQAAPLELTEVWATLSGASPARLTLVASAGWYLQDEEKDGEFFMPVELVGELIGVRGAAAPMAGSRILDELIKGGLLIVTQEAAPKRARRLKFVVKRTDLYRPPA